MAKQKDERLQQVGFWALVSCTLGLAPFMPEPHIVGKLKWLAGGAVGMEFMDWGDLLMHGAPWVMLLVSVVRLGISKLGQGKLASAKK